LDRFTPGSNASFGQKIFYIAVAEIESVVQPNGIGNDVRREAVAFLNIHPPILSTSVSYVGGTC